MKKIFTALAIVFSGLCTFAQIDVIDVTDGFNPTTPAKVLEIKVVSSVASGTAQVKSVTTLPVIETRDVIHSFTNFTYTFTYTNATGVAFTNTTDYVPLPLGPTVTSYATNRVVTAFTNHVPTATSTVVVTNNIGSGITCAAGVGSNAPSNVFIIPGEPVFYEGTAKGRVRLVIEK